MTHITPAHRKPASRPMHDPPPKTCYPATDTEASQLVCNDHEQLQAVLEELRRRHGIDKTAMPELHIYETAPDTHGNVVRGYHESSSASNAFGFNQKNIDAHTIGHEFKHFEQALLRGRLSFQDPQTYLEALIQGQVELLGTPGMMKTEFGFHHRPVFPRSALSKIRPLVASCLTLSYREVSQISSKIRDFVDKTLTAAETKEMGGRDDAINTLEDCITVEQDRLRVFRKDSSLLAVLYNDGYLEDLQKPLYSAEKQKAIRSVKEAVALADGNKYFKTADNLGQYLATPEECLARISGEAHRLRAMWQRRPELAKIWKNRPDKKTDYTEQYEYFFNNLKDQPYDYRRIDKIRSHIKIHHRLLKASRALHQYYQTGETALLSQIKTWLSQIEQWEDAAALDWSNGYGKQAYTWLEARLNEEILTNLEE